MKVLVVLAHYFSPEPNPAHSSVDEGRRAERKRALEQVVEGYRGCFGPAAYGRYAPMVYELADTGVQVDLRILTMQGCWLLDRDVAARHGARYVVVDNIQPRYLGFAAYKLFEKHAEDYDWFVFSEDDLVIRDPLFFEKVVWFNRTFGDKRVLSPNRIEWNTAQKPIKHYVDDDLPASIYTKLHEQVDDEDMLHGQALASPLTFQRAKNPHSGFFAVSRTQLAEWMSRPYWRLRDASFISPLESAATLGLARTFSVYKPHGLSANFLEIEHRDDRFSQFDWPRRYRREASEADEA